MARVKQPVSLGMRGSTPSHRLVTKLKNLQRADIALKYTVIGKNQRSHDNQQLKDQ